MAGHRDVIAWQRAMDLAVSCYGLTCTLRSARHYELASQLLDASVSVPSNIAEGHGRGTAKEFAHFCDYSMGSLREVDTLVVLTHRVGLAKPATPPTSSSKSTRLGASSTACAGPSASPRFPDVRRLTSV